MKYMLLFFVFVLLISVTPCLAKVMHLPLDEMIDRSKLILVGRVVKLAEAARIEGPKNSVEDFDQAIATIEIEQIISGTYDGKQIDIPYHPRLSISPLFRIDERCIFFIGQSNFVLQGYAGKIWIDKEENIQVLFILGEQEKQTLKYFIQKIKDRKLRGGAIQ